MNAGVPIKIFVRLFAVSALGVPLIVLTAPANAAGPVSLSQKASLLEKTADQNTVQQHSTTATGSLMAVSMPVGALVPRGAVQAQPLARVGVPVNLLPEVVCFPHEPAKACDARRAAQRRAIEVIVTEGPSPVEESDQRRWAAPRGLLIPVAQTIPPKTPNAAVCDPRVDPRLTEEECARLRREFGVPGPVPPVPPSPPVTPVPQAAPAPPVAADPEAVITPPPTGDRELVQPPPASASKMPVVKPKPNPPVIQ